MTDEKFELIMAFVFLAKSGLYKRSKELVSELHRKYPHLTEEDNISVCQPAIKSLCDASK